MNDAEGHGLTPLFREMIAMRNRHHQELDGMLRGVGEAPDESGSFMSTCTARSSKSDRYSVDWAKASCPA